MIYRIENGQKVALDAMLDNSWEIEYSRDLSSQLISGQNEWTATEDCWFQHTIFWNATVPNTPYYCYLNNTTIVSITARADDRFPQVTNVLLKKGDKVSLINAQGDKYPFIHPTEEDAKASKLRIFPVHRLLSPRENVVTVTLQLQANSGSVNGKYTVSLYPLGNDIYLFCLPTGGIQFRPWSTDVASLFFSIEGFDMLDLKLDYWQVATGIPDYVGTTSNNTDPSQWIACVKPSNTEWNIFMRGHGIIRRR